MKIQIEQEAIDWAQTTDHNPQVAMLPFDWVFFQDVDISTRITVSSPVKVRYAVPESQQLARSALGSDEKQPLSAVV